MTALIMVIIKIQGMVLNASPLGGTTNDYDKLTGHSTSKNALVVANANDANVDAQGIYYL